MARWEREVIAAVGVDRDAVEVDPGVVRGNPKRDPGF
jgi:hypothetical protein